MAFSFFGDLENAAFQKNLFFSARPRSVFPLSFFLVFEGVWKSKPIALELLLIDFLNILVILFGATQFPRKTKPVSPDLWKQVDMSIRHLFHNIGLFEKFRLHSLFSYPIQIEKEGINKDIEKESTKTSQDKEYYIDYNI